MHDRLGNEVLDTFPDNVEVARNEAPNQIRLDSLSVGEGRFIINILHLQSAESQVELTAISISSNSLTKLFMSAGREASRARRLRFSSAGRPSEDRGMTTLFSIPPSLLLPKK